MRELKQKIIDSLKAPVDPFVSATSLAMGVFWACTPFYGFQTALIGFSSWLFRLNFPIAFLGSQISLPPFYGAIVPAQVYLGLRILGRPWTWEGEFLEAAQGHLLAWFLGSAIMSPLLALLFGAVWFWAQRCFNKAFDK